ncbi:MAG: hypothetical protein O2960_07820 [Verrucomicrobia bacterium]|nr:hypothetical protein [Verrucomicrobiota bacterium]
MKSFKPLTFRNEDSPKSNGGFAPVSPQKAMSVSPVRSGKAVFEKRTALSGVPAFWPMGKSKPPTTDANWNLESKMVGRHFVEP